MTGGTRGIGLATAELLVAGGARVCVTGRKAEHLDAALRRLGGPEHAIGVCGSSDDESHQATVIDAVIASFGRIDLLVNNAGINPAFGPLGDLEPRAARKIFDVAELITFLLSDRSDWITGQVVTIDGGALLAGPS
ncbi:SDR family oxidoreductase [Amycolatopsis panacis]|uniref:SDR family oxidoreductase n=1 Tax=Amycolatopsis panacis TaxID=2340917 RepID=UPI0018F459C7|nr:SDR family oxidoreductase [Amycolatopsis panacis]